MDIATPGTIGQFFPNFSPIVASKTSTSTGCRHNQRISQATTLIQ